jgi:hypothetical protein
MDKLLELELKKIIQEYKLLEIEEEWKNELINSNKEKFLREISMNRTSDDKEEEIPVKIDPEKEPEVSNDSTNKQIPENIKKIYREIVKLTHPDKTRGKNNRGELNDMYIKSKIAVDEHDIYSLLVICDKLEIKWLIDISEKKILEDNLVIKREKLKSMESSYIWKWINAETEEDKLKIVNLFIENNN